MLWSKSLNDLLLMLVLFEGDYVDCVDDNEIINETNAYFSTHSKMIPNAHASELYTEYSGDINNTKTAAIAKVITEIVDVDKALEEYVTLVGAAVDDVFADLNK